MLRGLIYVDIYYHNFVCATSQPSISTGKNFQNIGKNPKIVDLLVGFGLLFRNYQLCFVKTVYKIPQFQQTLRLPEIYV